MRKLTIIIITKEDEIEAWGTLTALCKYHRLFKYSYLKAKKFPFTYKGWSFKKELINQ